MRLQDLVSGDHLIDWDDGEAVSVSLSGRPEIGDKEILVLLQHPSIKKLYLGDTGLTDEGVKSLRGLPQLEWLELSDTATTDIGIAGLAEMSTLQHLFLYGCQVTDASLPALLSLTGLQEIGLDETLISKKGRTTIKRAFPEIEIS